ncbi:hypothetical protein MNB_SV-6-921 [hydrothermal vent metagenome]|uniref:Uncharacterized protein n=1 Tax=hydrothermal vent metagenome TaxID=652676 RepID=A0A1W1B8P7_9ZZZZ
MVSMVSMVSADDNNSTEHNRSKKTNITKSEVEKQIEREKIYAKEKRFYQGSEYNLSSSEVNKESLKHIKKIEPDYDFDMDDVYSDIQ